MSDWNEIWSFKTARFSVSLAWAWEDYGDLSWDDTGEAQAKIESGEWGNYCFRVRVLCDGREVGVDYLGNSIYANPAEFRDHIGLAAKSREDGRRYGSCFVDMVREAVGAARKALNNPPRIRQTATHGA